MTARQRARAAAVLALTPVWTRLRPRIETIAREVARQTVDDDVQRLSPELQFIRDELRDLRIHVDRLVGEAHARLDDVDDKLRLMAAQLAAVDTRVAQLERPAVDLAADGADRAEAKRLIDEIRTEHNRARSRLAAVAFYEERISRLEREVVR